MVIRSTRHGLAESPPSIPVRGNIIGWLRTIASIIACYMREHRDPANGFLLACLQSTSHCSRKPQSTHLEGIPGAGDFHQACHGGLSHVAGNDAKVERSMHKHLSLSRPVARAGWVFFGTAPHANRSPDSPSASPKVAELWQWIAVFLDPFSSMSFIFAGFYSAP